MEEEFLLKIIMNSAKMYNILTWMQLFFKIQKGPLSNGASSERFPKWHFIITMMSIFSLSHKYSFLERSTLCVFRSHLIDKIYKSSNRCNRISITSISTSKKVVGCSQDPGFHRLGAKLHENF